MSENKKTAQKICSCSDIDVSKMFLDKDFLLRDCLFNVLSDDELKSKWTESVQNQEYEKSSIYYTEMIERNIVKPKNKNDE